MSPAPRPLARRIEDTRRRLTEDVDCWVASASSSAPYLIPLSFFWDGTDLFVATLAASATSRNLLATGKARVGVGPTRDVVLIEATVRAMNDDEIVPEFADAFAVNAGFDPRLEANQYIYFRITPQRIQAWREADELPGRDLMRNGVWITRPAGATPP
jgi:hypothetical protein